MLGLTRGVVELLPHREEWHRLFADERDRLLDGIGGPSLPIEHIGSTAICGIAAKPILDIIIGTPEFLPEIPFVTDLEAIGYEYKGENGISERHYFGKGEPRTVHLNVVRFGGQFWLSHLAFRDHLKNNRDAALEYERIKLSLAERFPNDREAYTKGKEEFVRSIIAHAMGTEI
jgi:GrpB-like predicted nucleotidyltransferase (UPF0157 family)